MEIGKWKITSFVRLASGKKSSKKLKVMAELQVIMTEAYRPKDHAIETGYSNHSLASIGESLGHSQLGPVAKDGHIVDDSVISRRGEIHSLFETKPSAESIVEHNPGAIVLIPIHADSRISTIEHTLKSLSDQNYTDGLHIVIADNGLSGDGRKN